MPVGGNPCASIQVSPALWSALRWSGAWEVRPRRRRLRCASATRVPSIRRRPPRRSTGKSRIPAGTRIGVRLETGVSSRGSRIEQPVNATVIAPLRIGGAQVIPSGSQVRGDVVTAQPSGKVKGRARLAIRFRTLSVGGQCVSHCCAGLQSRPGNQEEGCRRDWDPCGRRSRHRCTGRRPEGCGNRRDRRCRGGNGRGPLDARQGSIAAEGIGRRAETAEGRDGESAGEVGLAYHGKSLDRRGTLSSRDLASARYHVKSSALGSMSSAQVARDRLRGEPPRSAGQSAAGMRARAREI